MSRARRAGSKPTNATDMSGREIREVFDALGLAANVPAPVPATAPTPLIYFPVSGSTTPLPQQRSL